MADVAAASFDSDAFSADPLEASFAFSACVADSDAAFSDSAAALAESRASFAYPDTFSTTSPNGSGFSSSSGFPASGRRITGILTAFTV